MKVFCINSTTYLRTKQISVTKCFTLLPHCTLCVSNITKCSRTHDDSIGDELDMQRLFAGAQCRQFLEQNLKYNVFSTCQACLRAEGG